MKKKLWILLAAAVLLAASAMILFRFFFANPYTYTLTLTDADGQAVEDIHSMTKGDTLYVTLTMKGPKKEETLDVYGLEGTLTVSGMEYCGDGVPFANEACASYKKQRVSATETVDFLYYDINGVGITVGNPCTIGTCSFTLTDPEAAEINVSTALLYRTGEEKAYEILAK